MVDIIFGQREKNSSQSHERMQTTHNSDLKSSSAPSAQRSAHSPSQSVSQPTEQKNKYTNFQFRLNKNPLSRLFFKLGRKRNRINT